MPSLRDATRRAHDCKWQNSPKNGQFQSAVQRPNQLKNTWSPASRDAVLPSRVADKALFFQRCLPSVAIAWLTILVRLWEQVFHSDCLYF
ncbi:MAG: hypothetical protein V7K71_04340 [Nostoc sp.]|uniref:hypothetical protein n=1 Tax=Nostoc sp. TaxID=1180 RepID=UPI002FF694E2